MSYPETDDKASQHVQQVLAQLSLDHAQYVQQVLALDHAPQAAQIQLMKKDLASAIASIGMHQKKQRNNEKLVDSGTMTWTDHIANAFHTDWTVTLIRDSYILKTWPLLKLYAPTSPIAKDATLKIQCWMGLRQLDAERHTQHVAFWTKHRESNPKQSEEMIDKSRQQLFIQYTRYSDMSFQKIKAFLYSME